MNSENQRLNNVKNDLSLMMQISKPSSITTLCAPANLKELGLLLKNKNKKLSCSAKEKEKAHDWLSHEGVNIEPLMGRIKNARELSQHKKQLKKMEEDCFFYIHDMSHRKVDEYLEKVHEYSTLSVVQKCMQRSNFTNEVIDRVRNRDFHSQRDKTGKKVSHSDNETQLGIIRNIQTQTRNEEKRRKYLDCVKDLANGLFQRHELSGQFSRRLNIKLWKIAGRHLNLEGKVGLGFDENLTQLCLESLQLIQRDYDSILPTSDESLNFYLSKNYLERLEAREEKYLRDREHGAYWGKVFLMYRAGRKNQFYRLLSSRHQNELIKEFKIIDESLKKKIPKFSHLEKNTDSDVFKEQLIFSLKGEAKYSSEVLGDVNSLDMVWIFIRNVGIFYKDKKATFEQFRNLVVEGYPSNSLSEQQLFNLIYLLCYDRVAQIGINEIMDQDDYLHFLICVVGNKVLNCDTPELKLKLSRELIAYAKEMIAKNEGQFVHYLCLIPEEHQVSEISSLMASSELISSSLMDWEKLRKGIPSEHAFSSIVSEALKLYISSTNDYVTAAEKCSQILKDHQQAVTYLLQFLIKSALENTPQTLNIEKAEQLVEQILYRTKASEIEQLTLEFFKEYRQLIELLGQTKNAEIFDLIRRSNFISLGGQVKPKILQLLESLVRLTGSQGFEAYFKFMGYVLKGAQNYYYNCSNTIELRRFVDFLRESLNGILANEHYQGYANKYEVKNLMSIIHSAVYEMC